MVEISKSDWKKYREKIADWQENYMERLLQEYIVFLNSDKPASEKFWKLEKMIKQDKKCHGVLIEMNKSSAIYDIAGLIKSDVIKLDDLHDFSEELQEAVRVIIDIKW